MLYGSRRTLHFLSVSVFYVSVHRKLSFSSPRLSDDSLTSTGEDLFSRRPYTFQTTSFHSLDSRQRPTVAGGNIRSSPGDVDTQRYCSSLRSAAGDSRFWSDRRPAAPRRTIATAGSSPVRPAVRQTLFPVSSGRHSSLLYGSSEFVRPPPPPSPASHFDRTFTDYSTLAGNT